MNVSMICFKEVHFAAPFISRNSNSPLCKMNCLRQSGLLYGWEKTGIYHRPDRMFLM